MAGTELELPMHREHHDATMRINRDSDGEPETVDLGHHYPTTTHSETGNVLRGAADLRCEIEQWGISEYVDVVTRSVVPDAGASRPRRIEWLRIVQIDPNETTSTRPHVLTVNPQNAENVTRRDGEEFDAHLSGSNEHVLLKYCERATATAEIDETVTRINREIIDALGGEWYIVRWDGLEHDHGGEIDHEITNLNVQQLKPLTDE